MAKSFSNLKDPKLGFHDQLPFGKFVGCRVHDIMPEDYEYILWLHEKQPNLFTREVIDEAIALRTEAAAEQHYNEEVKPYSGTSQWFSDWDDDIPF